MQTELLKQLNSTLKPFSQYWDGENLRRYAVIDDLQKKTPELIKALIANPKIKEIYSTDIEGTLIFDFDKLISLLKYKEYWADSFTKYRNKVGLTSEGKYLDYNSDVVLDFPFKDCVLEGGMTKEDQGKDEVYYNEIIARDEIDRLFSPKVLNNAKRYSKEGVEENITAFNDDDNLIIKGNNLIALHSLKERYAGKVKLIYIDPPYNTKEDSFRYNDRFNRSSYLTFIKNRIEVAYEMLDNDGVLAVQCSFHEYAYLKILLDSILSIANHILTFNILVRHPERNLTTDKQFNDVIEYTLIYSKSTNYKLPKIEKKKLIDDYIYRIELLNEQPDDLLVIDNKNIPVYLPNNYKLIKTNADENNLKTISIRGSIREKNSSGRFYVKNLENLINKYPKETLFLVPDMGDDKYEYRYFQLPREGNKNGIYFQGMPLSNDTTLLPYANFIDFHQQYNLVNNEGVYSFRNGKKPEDLIRFYMDIFTIENELILDFHLGSGTTAAVAHKMGRRYIGIEQMDYINEITVPRLQKVIEGEQGGISKDVNWQGGGSFVYAELMELNYLFIHQIKQAQSYEALERLFDVMKAEAHLNYQVALENVLSKEYEVDGIHRLMAFSELELHEQKRLLIEILDKNQLYVSTSEMDDEALAVSESDKAFNQSFYGKDI